MARKAPVIDIHCHAAGLGFGDSGCFISPAMKRNWRFKVFLRAFGVTPQAMSKDGDRTVHALHIADVERPGYAF